jgi:AraC-like DNA-binding protein
VCSADPAHYTVDAIAHRCGFTNRSRFAAAHETMYDKHRSERCAPHTDHPTRERPAKRESLSK